ncbi:MAG TPA: hypothetical protein VFW87_05285, partial [Pirellulales bacterium]|nr:hypothetical protein [Pirellulales bacterium]
LGYGMGMGMGGYGGPMLGGFGGYGGYGGYGAGYSGWGYGRGGRYFGAHHGWHHGGFGGYGGCGGAMNSNWDGYCNQCGGDSCGHVKVRHRCRRLGCGAGPYIDPNCGCAAPEACAPARHHRCRLFHRHHRSAPCCVDACCEGGLDGAVGYDSGDGMSVPSQGDRYIQPQGDRSIESQDDSEQLQVPPPVGDEKPMPLPPDADDAA